MNQPTKIAVATEDGVRVSAHFGRAPYFEVLTLQDGEIVTRERRAKTFHQGPRQHGDGNGSGQGSHASGMITAVSDCVAVIAGGMGRPAFAAIQSAGLQPILTDIRDVEQVGRAFAAGTLTNRLELLH
jgi:predicted Fe-Mo cluster-binding NifX family protein